MNAKESLELYRQDGAAWNRWARALLAERQELQEAGEWTGDETAGRHNASTRDWLKRAAVDFSGHTFDEERVRFERYCFPGDAKFRGAKFKNAATFYGAVFHGWADFSDAEFDGDSRFGEAIFHGAASFNNMKAVDSFSLVGTVFHNQASFGQARFSGDVHFNTGQFHGHTDFSYASFLDRAVYWRSEFHDTVRFWGAEFRHSVDFNATEFRAAADFINCRFSGATLFFRSVFHDRAEFRAIQVSGMFSLAESEFSRLPAFSEAHFLEAPALDEVDLNFERFQAERVTATETSLSLRWRALRKVAQQGRDDERALSFFKAEVLSRRHREDKIWHLRLWVGLLYQAMSDFGLSIGRPILWLAGTYVFFSLGYLLPAVVTSGVPAGFCSMACKAAAGHKLTAALIVSLHYTSPFTLLGHSELVKGNAVCLYGSGEGGAAFPDGVPAELTTAAIPAWLHAAGALQFLISSVLIFLILLAIRNLFRIR